MNGVAGAPLISSTDFVAPDTSARWAPVASLPAGGSITVYMCAKVTTSTANATVRNQANVTWTGGSAQAQALQVVGARFRARYTKTRTLPVFRQVLAIRRSLV